MSELDDYSGLLDKENVTEVEAPVIVETEVEAAPETEAVEAEAETIEEQPEEAEQTTGSEDKPWTLSAVLDEREKRQARDKTIAELQQKLSAYEKPEDEVSIFEDEQGAKDQQNQKIAQSLRNTELNMSQAFAEKEFGEDKIAAVTDWFKKDGVQSPAALKRFNEAKLPFHELVSMYDDDLIMRDPAAYKANLAAEVRAEFEAETKKPNTPSLASSRSVGEKSLSTDNFEDILNE